MAPLVLLAVCIGALTVSVVGMCGRRTQEQYDRLAAMGFIAGGGAVAALLWLVAIHPPH